MTPYVEPPRSRLLLRASALALVGAALLSRALLALAPARYACARGAAAPLHRAARAAWSLALHRCMGAAAWAEFFGRRGAAAHPTHVLAVSLAVVALIWVSARQHRCPRTCLRARPFLHTCCPVWRPSGAPAPSGGACPRAACGAAARLVACPALAPTLWHPR